MLKHKKIESVIDEMARQLGHELNGQDKLVIRTKTAMVLAAKQRHRQRMRGQTLGVGQRDRRRADKFRVQAELWTGGIAQAAVDAAGELMVFRHLCRRLGIWPLIRRARITDDVRLNGFQAFDKVGHIDHQIALNREVAQRFNLHAVGVITQEGFARQFRYIVDHHAAGAADRHTAGPAVAQVRCQVILDVAQRIQQ